MSVYRLGPESDIAEGQARFFDVDGKDIAVARSGGTLYAFDDVCTHAGCFLSEGEVSGTTITCPCHGGVFDLVTGDVLEGPPPEPISTYPLHISEGVISVVLDE